MIDTSTTRLSAVIHQKVYNTANQHIGKIEDAVVYTMGGQVAYLVMSFQQQDADKLFAIPWQAFYFNQEDSPKIILDVRESKLKNAPGFNKDQWPKHPQMAFINKVYAYYEFEPVFLENNKPSQAKGHDIGQPGLDTNRESPDMEDSSMERTSIERQGIGNPRKRHENRRREL